MTQPHHTPNAVCEQCGTSFRVIPSMVGKARYCSRPCFYAARKWPTHFLPDDIDRFWSGVDRRGLDECWEWKRSRKRGGYGAFGFRGKIIAASRIAWMLTHGDIPDGLWVLHECDNPPCCNPAHLFLGTQADNNRDMFAKGRNVVGESRLGSKHVLAKLTPDQVRDARARYAQGTISIKAIAAEYSISAHNMARVLRRESYRDVD